MRTRGSSLAGAVCVIAVALLAVLTVGTASSVNVQMLLRSENAQTASLLADSAIQQALAELMKDPTWGTVQTTQIQYAGPVEQSDVRLTFNKTLGVPYCTRNDDSNPLPAWPGGKLLEGGLIPGKRLHLVAVAHCRNVTRTREAVVYVPSFTLSLGATGKVHLIDSIVGCLNTMEGVDLDTIAADPSKLEPGDLGTNSSDPQAALLEQGSRVVGNLQAGGGVSVLDNSTVGGEVRAYHGQTELPHFDFAAYDPAVGGSLNYNTLPPGIQADQNLSGVIRCAGPSLTINGDLNLDNALLFVDGSLTVTGSVRGTGAVVVTGSTTVNGGSGLTSADSVALLSRGDLRLVSPSTTKYTFQGLAYTRGNFKAKNFTVVGGFVADGLTPDKGQIEMEGCLAIRIPGLTSLQMYFPVQMVIQVASTANGPTEKEIPLAVSPTGEVLQKATIGLSPARPVTPGASPEVWMDSAVPPSPLPPGDHPPSYAAIGTPYAAATFNNQVDGDGHWGPNPWWNPALVQIRRVTLNGVKVFVFDLIYTENNNLKVQTFANTNEDIALDACCQAIASLGLSRTPGWFTGANNDPGGANHKAAYKAMIQTWSEKGLLPAGGLTNLTFDPNRFLKDSDKLRLSAWTEY